MAITGGGGSSGGVAGVSGYISSSGCHGAQAILVGGSGGGDNVATDGMGIKNPIIKKRVWEGALSVGPTGNQGGQLDVENPFQCRV